ncbi:hypothetical protein TRAPUB_1159 [Trametes pubescens]|uniref:Uncharacterized protein n=1 Tax=Trametes pubescens TaxID=154538 RepID=A0A1M2VK51_TRAPU|nr:hypothetical protein TRAPUB_1159 [Trametes pubescens]
MDETAKNAAANRGREIADAEFEGGEEGGEEDGECECDWGTVTGSTRTSLKQ